MLNAKKNTKNRASIKIIIPIRFFMCYPPDIDPGQASQGKPDNTTS
jgi:hypothetical protein